MLRCTLITLCLAALFGAPCFADAIYNVRLDTAPLVGNVNAPFALDFQLTSGNTTSGVVNAVSLSRFSFGAGGSAGTGRPFANSGNASGDLNATVTLSTSGGTFFSEFSQYFKPGSNLTFRLDLTNNAQTSNTPDEFTFQLIDRTGGEISTTDPSGSNSVFIIDLTGATLKPLTYTVNGDGVTITPQVTPSVPSSVPEPDTALFALIAVGLLFAWQRVRRVRC